MTEKTYQIPLYPQEQEDLLVYIAKQNEVLSALYDVLATSTVALEKSLDYLQVEDDDSEADDETDDEFEDDDDDEDFSEILDKFLLGNPIRYWLENSENLNGQFYHQDYRNPVSLVCIAHNGSKRLHLRTPKGYVYVKYNELLTDWVNGGLSYHPFTY